MQANALTQIDHLHRDLDEPEFRKVFSSDGEHFKFYIQGVKCSKCVQSLESLPEQFPEIKESRYNWEKQILSLALNNKKELLAPSLRYIQKKGFLAVPVRPREAVDHLLKNENRADLIRLAVGGFLFGNIMLFSFANYFGAPAEFSSLFNWFSFILYLPILLYVAIPFYRGTISSIKDRKLSIDLPMTAASVLGFAFSTINLVRGSEDIYFDSTAGFLFLILTSRFLQKRMIQKAYAHTNQLEVTTDYSSKKIVDGKIVNVPKESIQVFDQLIFETDQVLSVDVKVLSQKNAMLNFAFMTGESVPRPVQVGQVLPAGAYVTEGTFIGEVVNLEANTVLGKIIEQLKNENLKSSNLIGIADKASNWLVGSVFSIAFIFVFLSYGVIGWEESLKRALALIVLACPCAMALGAPLAMRYGLKKALTHGILVKSAGALESFHKIKNLIFDKTGTLTHSLSIFKNSPSRNLEKEWGDIVYSLEAISSHPIAQALINELKSLNPKLLKIRDHSEKSGVGVEGYINNEFYEVKRNPNNIQKNVALFKNGTPLFTWIIEENNDEVSKEVLKYFKNQNKNLIMSSGDQKNIATEVGYSLGFSSNNIYSEMKPEDKLALVQSKNPCIMIGDGINDSLALKASTVGVAVGGSLALATQSSDIILLKPGIHALVSLDQISKMTYKLIIQNLYVSGIYNAAGAALALSGYINPYIAALLMPISSFFILLSTYLRVGR